MGAAILPSFTRRFKVAAMMGAILAMLASGVLTAGEPLQSGTALSFRGSVAQVDRDRTPGEPEKNFDLTLLLADVGAADARVYWLIEERGRGAWAWAQRFGSAPVDSQWSADETLLPSLLYDREDGSTVIPLNLPMFAAEQPLAEGATWESDPWTYLVEKSEKLDDREAWKVDVSNSYGPKRVLWVDPASPLVVGYNERVFMGMGQEYELRLRLVGAEQLPADRLAGAVAGYDALLALRGKLNLPGRSQDTDWNEKQLTELADALPGVEAAAKEPHLAKVARAARKDLDLQSGRVSAAGDLKAQFEGREVEKFSIQGASGETLSEADLRDKVTVLHFWDYREPLEEPYGQMGYLDFLYMHRKESGLAVYGVAVDARLADEETRSAAVRGVRKVKSFMMLGYPVLLDGGALIKQLGDPRIIGAELPLFVVIGQDGTILHYHVGCYEVDRNQGLKELDAIVSEALSKK